jgi:hypothetical protein
MYRRYYMQVRQCSTKECARKDIMLMKQKLGHRSIRSTQIYVQLLQGHRKEEYVCKVATTLEEAQELMHACRRRYCYLSAKFLW